jgi:hypothetical protein
MSDSGLRSIGSPAAYSAPPGPTKILALDLHK